MLISDLSGRDIAILGTGREGRAAERWIRQHVGEQPLTFYTESMDQEDGTHLGPRDRLVRGPLSGRRLSRHEVIIRSPGISPYRAALSEAIEAGVGMTTGTDLWLAQNPEARSLCVTGTKGKSTTTALIAHLLNACGERVAAAGNIGVPLLECDASSADWWVVELSSYQTCDLEQSVFMSLVLNLSDEHLDWHGGADRYRRDKLRLLDQAPPGRRIANASDHELVSRLASRGGVDWFNLPDGFHVKQGELFRAEDAISVPSNLPGSHNLANLAAALTVVEKLGFWPADLMGVLEQFEPLPHRLQQIGEADGLEYFDDSLSTTPVATLAALEALGGRPVTVLVGGLDRGIEWASYADAFAAGSAHALVGMPDSGASIMDALEQVGLRLPGGLHVADGMQHAVEKARELTPRGGVVLLSPGAPSFPQFRNFQERGLAFRTAALDRS